MAADPLVAPIAIENIQRIRAFITKKLIYRLTPRGRRKFKPLVHKLLMSTAHREEILKRMSSIYESSHVQQTRYRTVARIDDMHLVLDEHRSVINSYLDVGAGDGKIAEAVAKYLRLPTAHAVDITPIPARPRITTHLTDGIILPFEDNAFDFMTAYMSMHHFTHLTPMLQEMRRVLKPDGLLLIREHDVSMHSVTVQYLYWVHVLYHAVTEHKTPYTYTPATYRTVTEWDDIMADTMNMHTIRYRDNEDRFNSYYALYAKIE